jgi:branched-chain amino acid aminotransferase
MTVRISIDGRIVTQEEATVPVLDHGFLFGDSVYDVIRTRHGRPFLAVPHLDRLRASAAALALRIPLSDDALLEDIDTLIAAAGNDETYVRIVVTRGVGDLELSPETCDAPRVILIARPLVPPPARQYEEGIRIAIVDRRRTAPDALDPAVKSGNYLNSVLAIVEARERGAEDAVLLNAAGHLTESTTANVFFVTDGVARTPALECGLLRGITRGLVLDLLAESGVPTEEGRFTAAEFGNADEAFITSTTRDVVPVGEVDGERFPAVPGPVTRTLMDRFAAM